ncbi:MAG TPA: hypothetical protein VJ461_01275 [Candidatus Nanoarchaeia archaeon]|nr:hypothetical protein [Candidatus Nanoarchaeia archaeon]
MEKKGFRIKFSAPEKKKYEQVPDMAPGEVRVEYNQPSFLGRLFSFRRGLIKETEKTEDLSPEDMAKLRSMEDDIEATEEKIVEKEEEVKEIKEEEEALIEKREGLLTKFFGRINVFKRRPMEAAEVSVDEMEKEPSIDPEVVEVIKIMHKWLNELPPGKKRSFKASSDFQKYKEILEKHGLVKKKG